ncbi:hypothetical protein PFISCL1PPCAC_12198, partial [Pristionchus fissidentatus]
VKFIGIDQGRGQRKREGEKVLREMVNGNGVGGERESRTDRLRQSRANQRTSRFECDEGGGEEAEATPTTITVIIKEYGIDRRNRSNPAKVGMGERGVGVEEEEEPRVDNFDSR